MKIYLKSFTKIKTLIFVITLMLVSCTKNEEPILPPSIEMSYDDSEITIAFEEKLVLTATATSNTHYNQEWEVDGKQVSTESSYTFPATETGVYIINFRAYNEAGEFKKEYTVTVDVKERPITDESNIYVTTLFEYKPAPGQFINKAPGNHESAEGILGGKGMVTLGAWGGYIVLGFDHTVVNSDGEDIIIYGNAMNTFSEPGIVHVMQDENGNGRPDDTWYELAGSGHLAEVTIRD